MIKEKIKCLIKSLKEYLNFGMWFIILVVCLFLIYPISNPNLSEIYKKVNPAVVWIGAETGENDTEYYNDYSLYEQGIKWQGSGFVISPDGLIVTAGHVVEDTKTFQLVFSDGKKGMGVFAYRENPETADVGFIQIVSIDRVSYWRLFNPVNFVNWLMSNEIPLKPIKNLPYVKLTDRVKIAEEVVIVGYPWGLQKSSTIAQGIISALNRDIPFFGKKFMIHTDTSSWPGNSGSPVFNMNGKVVGILVGGVYEYDNFSLCTPGKIVILALNKYKAEKAMKEAK